MKLMEDPQIEHFPMNKPHLIAYTRKIRNKPNFKLLHVVILEKNEEPLYDGEDDYVVTEDEVCQFMNATGVLDFVKTMEERGLITLEITDSQPPPKPYSFFMSDRQ